MKIHKSHLGIAIMFGMFSNIIAAKAQSSKPPQLGKNSIEEVIAAMTLKEKVTLLVGAGKAPKPKSAGVGVSNGWVPEPPMIGHTETKVSGAAGNTTGIPRLGIPSMVMSDGPAGVRISPTRKGDDQTYYATAFPVGTLLASTWDTAMINQVGRAFGNEVKEYGVDILLAPGVNIHRNPLNGRNFEYYSEDPVVAGWMAGAFIKGIQSNGVGTSIKHFIANNQESNRNYNNSIVSQRALRELYLKVFRIAIAASDPWTVMSSYNRMNGLYTAQRHDLLTTVLRDEWKFKGFVMSDWGGGYDWIEEMKAGNDLIMPGRPDQIETLIAAVQQDSLSMKVLDKNVAHMLHIILESPSFKNYKYSNKPDLKAHATIAREAAAEGMILLKNVANTLPINDEATRAAMFGNATYNTLAGGTGSGEVNKAYTISMYQGLTNAGYKADAQLEQTYQSYFKHYKDSMASEKNLHPEMQYWGDIPEMTVSGNDIEIAAASNNVAIITIGRNAGEGWDRPLDNNYNLTQPEQQQIRNIAAAFHSKDKKVIAVLNIGGVIDMKGWQENMDAILLAWQGGQETGNAVADIISGKLNPSGRLATTFPINYEDVPSAKNFPGTPAHNPEQVVYEEGIYVGYRYHQSFNVKPMYAFGYGLSYTQFDIDNLKINNPVFKNKLTATVTVKNTGKVAGKEVVQLYITAPAQSIDKPAQELKAFAKTRLLGPGESQQISFTISEADLASFHSNTSEWITDAGSYILKVGDASDHINQSANFELPKTIIVEKVHDVLKPEVQINELKSVR